VPHAACATTAHRKWYRIRACRRDSRANPPVHEACASYTQEGSCCNSRTNAKVSGGLEAYTGGQNMRKRRLSSEKISEGQREASRRQTGPVSLGRSVDW
jgi:hypothetical protein